MIKLYHAYPTRSLRVRWLMEELGLEYDIERIAFSKGEHKSPEYLAIHPLGRLPAMTDGDVKMFESGAMLEYIMDKHGDGGLRPKGGTAASAEYLQWFHFGESTFQPYLSIIARHSVILPEEDRILAAAADAQGGVTDCLALLNAHLEGKEFIAGDSFSAADIMTAYPLVLANLFGILPSDDYPNVVKYYAGISARAAFQAATAD